MFTNMPDVSQQRSLRNADQPKFVSSSVVNLPLLYSALILYLSRSAPDNPGHLYALFARAFYLAMHSGGRGRHWLISKPRHFQTRGIGNTLIQRS